LSQSNERINELNRALSKAESAAKHAQQNDIELRRLRSELQSLQAQREKTPDSSEIIRRDEQIEQLKKRLAEAQQESQPIKPTSNIRPSKPALRSVPKEKDDLKRIKGIGPVIERTLNSLGITTFKQIAELNEADIQRISEALDTFPGRIERDDWIGGARKHYQLKYKDKAEA